MNPVRLFWWKPPSGIKKIFNLRYRNVSQNFGDEISRYIVEQVTERKVVRANAVEKNKLLALGSILHFAQEGDTVWGSGINGKKLDVEIPNIKVLSVRGPKTREHLLKMGIVCPEVYGDPGVLISRYFKINMESSNEFGIVPHFSELKHPELRKYKKHVINPIDNFENVVKKINSCKLILSSSLHGLIIAESYGIPAILLRITDNEPLYKYEDYYLGTKRSLPVYVNSIQKGLSISPPNMLNLEFTPMIEALTKWSNLVV